MVLPIVLQYAKIEDMTIESFESFSNQKASLLSRENTGSRIDPSTPLPFRFFSFLYRPLFFDVNGLPAFIASLENLILLLLSIRALFSNPIKSFMSAPFIIKGLFFFLIIGTIIFGISLGNIGVMLRMRNMFLPGMILCLLWSFSYRKQVKQSHL
jgi:hypothetical protein